MYARWCKSQTQAAFPSVALFQRQDWSSQADLIPLQKCFLGWLIDSPKDEPPCNSLPPSAMVPGKSCNCTDSWSHEIIENFEWQHTNYRCVSFTPSTALVSGVPTYSMTLQAFFNCKLRIIAKTCQCLCDADNVTASLKASSQEEAPSLYMAIYDPRLDLKDALTRGYTRLILVNANADSSINLGLRNRQAIGYPPAYDYGWIPSIVNPIMLC